jgi:probable rRNA maturation factor
VNVRGIAADLLAITITNRQKSLRIDRKRMRRAIQTILRDADIAEAQISVAVVDDVTIAKLHERFLSDPDPTDVLSFLMERSPKVLEGEVVVSADTAQAAAPRYGHTAEDELLLYVIHGTLHLVGYDDSTPRMRAVMQRKEREYLAQTETRANRETTSTTKTQRHKAGAR